jgi:uncharacterized OsmC-like protein
VEPHVVVRSNRGHPFQQLVTLGAGHGLVADEPAAVGGEDGGPGPYELLLASLGSCKSMTVAMYARRKQWPLEEVVVRLRHDRIHAQDCAECDAQAVAKVAFVDQLECEVELVGPLDATQRQRLLEIADKCPVHRTLTSEVRITTRAAPAQV